MLDPFYLIVDSAAWIERLLPHGVRLVQLRIKDVRVEQRRAEIAKAKDLCTRAGAQLIVNDYWHDAIELGCDYVHLGQGDLDTADVAAIRKAGLKLGVSTHDEAELTRALSFSPDYIALGPIYPTILKQMPFAPQGLARLGEWRAKIGTTPPDHGAFGLDQSKSANVIDFDLKRDAGSKPLDTFAHPALVGIGGISLDRAKGVLEAGADSAAVVTDITLNADPEARCRAWVEATRPFVSA